METSFALDLLGRSASPAVVLAGADQIDRVTDVLTGDDGTTEALVHGEPAHVVTWVEEQPLTSASCTCGQATNDRLCAHAIAARLQSLGLANDLDAAMMARWLSRIAALEALSQGWKGLADFLLASEAADEPAATQTVLRDVVTVDGGINVARALVGRASEDQLSSFLVALAEAHGIDGLTTLNAVGIVAAEELVAHLWRPLDDRAPEANAAALLRVIGSVRHTVTGDEDRRSLSWSLLLACSAVGGLVAGGHVAPGAAAEVILRTELDSGDATYPWIALMMDRLGDGAPAVAAKMRVLLQDQDSALPGALPAERVARLRAEIALAIGDVPGLVDALTSWPGAPYGEYLTRLPRSWSLRPHLDVLEAARSTGRVRWAPGWPQHNPHDSDGPRLIHLVHDLLPHHPMWGDVAIGDLVVTLARLGDPDKATDALRQHALRLPDQTHRHEFIRIWNQASLGDEGEEMADEIFGSD
ncbi:hypothetical protein DEO23_01960 [Brachybacterium endophyticum]|uniref:SWIM-type domain-containing protein n=1 Tax=Brachybacterium endophyticum TaxID=2182385 RepID=A0A2U2RNL9_9MICO|nr:hypothetical protein [Brachybacterium endophyticum]PWH07426.1 hypothetical protein DEO23_01960 [Brachybacterium endophyticum]